MWPWPMRMVNRVKLTRWSWLEGPLSFYLAVIITSAVGKRLQVSRCSATTCSTCVLAKHNKKVLSSVRPNVVDVVREDCNCLPSSAPCPLLDSDYQEGHCLTPGVIYKEEVTATREQPHLQHGARGCHGYHPQPAYIWGLKRASILNTFSWSVLVDYQTQLICVWIFFCYKQIRHSRVF